MWWFEKKFVPKGEIGKGPLYQSSIHKIWLIVCFILGISVLIPFYYTNVSLTPQVWLMCLLLPVLGRLIALDLKHLILPDVYTIPLCVTGFIYSFFGIHTSITHAILGFMVAGGSLLVLCFLMDKYHKKSGIGGGDIKFAFAAGAFVGFFHLQYFFWLAFFFSLLFYPLLKAKNKYISFGPALAVSLWVILIWQQILPNIL